MNDEWDPEDWELDEMADAEGYADWRCAMCGAVVPYDQLPYCPDCEADLDRRDPIRPDPIPNEPVIIDFDLVPF